MPVGGYSTSSTPVCSEVPRWEWYWRTSDRNDETALATLASLQEVESSSVTPAPVRKAPTSRLMALDSWRVLVTNRERNTSPRIRSRRASTGRDRSEEHTSELQSLMRISYAVFCLKNKKKKH